MGSSRSMLIFILAVISDLLAPTTSQVLDGTCTSRAEFCWNCSDIGPYGNGSSYQENLNNLLSSFSSTRTTTQLNGGFYNSSLGQNPNKVYAVALCRGDLADLDKCHTCFNESNSILLQHCSNQKEAIIWAESCMVRYSSNSILGVEKDKPLKYAPSPNSATNPEQFNLVLYPLLETLSDKAALGGSLKKFAAGQDYVPGFETIFALVQCTPDIDNQSCSNCLKDSISDVRIYCDGKQGGRILKPSCQLRFEADPFFASTAGSPEPVNSTVPVNPSDQGKKSNTTKTIISIVVPVAVVIMLIVSICMILRVKKQRVKLENDTSDEMSLAESLQYDLDTVRSATDDFSDANKLGQGGFGAVYKGKLFNGQNIAVKRLSLNSQQGDREFKNEVMLVAQLQHRNLVRLLGFCSEALERLLIYEYLPNTSLDHFLIDPLKRAILGWETRYKIIRGIARGLLYLHEDSRLRIIHRDLKPNNILLDEDMNPKIADFGMARLFLVNETQGDTRTIAGTYGYMAPEYAMYGNFSVKSDVYSFGVLVLEIMSGQRINSFQYGENEEDLLSYAWRNWREATISNIIDPMLGTGSRSETMRCIHIGLLCVQENVSNRPTMASVVAMLNSHSVTLSVPSGPPLSMQTAIRSGMYSEQTESDKSKSSGYVSRNEASITQLFPR